MIELRDVYKYYGARRAVGPLTFRIAPGKVVGLVGLNGAGKTTTLRILAGDLLPTSGTLSVDACDLREQPRLARARVGYLPDRPPVHGELTVTEQLELAAGLWHVRRDQVSAAIQRALELTALAHRRNDLIATLSLGYRQRLGIAQAIVHRPRCVVLDEPISGLDPLQIVEMRKLVRELGREHTVVVSSHILGELSETCDELLLLSEGRVAASGTEAELAARLAAGQKLVLVVRDRAGLRESLQRKLAELPNVTSVSELPPSEAGSLRWEVVTSQDARADLANTVHGLEAQLLELAPQRTQLEQIFLGLSEPRTASSAEDVQS
jgi:ABC-2 type transport system ATP-binding protein